MGYEASYGGEITTKPMTAMDVKQLLSRINKNNEELELSRIKGDTRAALFEFLRLESGFRHADLVWDNYWEIKVIQEDENTGAKSYYITLSSGGLSRYNEDEVHNFFKAFTPFTKEGVVEYTGEDDSHWRFEFRNGRWYEDVGRIVYDEDNEHPL